ncbi:hypothetical protein TNCV_2512581 [Trichonephila clavipes]|nr:hypothetical protein TNCV_2512581 [Trichonephila clavipes]
MFGIIWALNKFKTYFGPPARESDHRSRSVNKWKHTLCRKWRLKPCSLSKTKDYRDEDLCHTPRQSCYEFATPSQRFNEEESGQDIAKGIVAKTNMQIASIKPDILTDIPRYQFLLMVINYLTPPERFNKKEPRLDLTIATVDTVNMQFGAKQARNVTGHSDIQVAIDGAWQMAAHASLNGDLD